MNIAIITGASSGLGKEFLKQIDSYNFDEIWVIARQREKLEALRDIIHTNLKIIPLDLSLNSSFKIYEEELKKEKPNVKLLINCAGFGKFGNYSEIPLEDSLKMIDLNCKALVSMTEKTLPFMNEFSKILQICSSSSFQPLPFANVYASTKAFVLSYSRALNYELRERRILVTAVCPGWVRTNFFETAKKTKNPNAVNNYAFMSDAKDVVKKALRDMKKNKSISIYGAFSLSQFVGTKFFPKDFIMNIWVMSQSKNK